MKVMDGDGLVIDDLNLEMGMGMIFEWDRDFDLAGMVHWRGVAWRWDGSGYCKTCDGNDRDSRYGRWYLNLVITLRFWRWRWHLRRWRWGW